jgi:hypothetical protein
MLLPNYAMGFAAVDALIELAGTGTTAARLRHILIKADARR